jgi:hypothetical protein
MPSVTGSLRGGTAPLALLTMRASEGAAKVHPCVAEWPADAEELTGDEPGLPAPGKGSACHTNSPCRCLMSRRKSPCRWASRTKSPCDGGVGRAFADGTGAETYMPVSGQESVPNAFEFLSNVILTADRPFLETTWSRPYTGSRSGDA